MSIVKYYASNIPKTKYLIDSGATASVYRLENDLVFKKFRLNMTYYELMEFHEYYFREYLDYLSRLNSDILVTPTDIYTRFGMVRGYTYPYQVGNRMDKLYPKTKVDRLLISIDKAYKELLAIDYLKLYDAHYNNILYTGEIKLIDLDFCKFKKTDPSENIGMVNKSIIEALLDIPVGNRIAGVNKKASTSYKEAINGSISASDFLRDYIELLEEKNGPVVYTKHLTKDFIKEGKRGRY